MSADSFAHHNRLPNAPARGSFAITPNDSADLASPIRQITIGTTGGTLSWVGHDGATQTTDALPVGTYPIAARRIRATGTTATGLTGWV